MKNKLYVYLIILLITILTPILIYSIIGLNNKNNYQPANNYSITKNSIVSIYIGCSTCPAADAKFLPGLVKAINDSLNIIAHEKGYKLIKIGVAKEENGLDEGINYLNKFDNFDEISVGNNWANLSIEKYIWEIKSSIPATPKLVITKRVYQELANGRIDYSNKKEKIIANLTGSSEIIGFYRNLNKFKIW